MASAATMRTTTTGIATGTAITAIMIEIVAGIMTAIMIATGIFEGTVRKPCLIRPPWPGVKNPYCPVAVIAFPSVDRVYRLNQLIM